jgi:hypothetical protein
VLFNPLVHRHVAKIFFRNDSLAIGYNASREKATRAVTKQAELCTDGEMRRMP